MNPEISPMNPTMSESKKLKGKYSLGFKGIWDSGGLNPI